MLLILDFYYLASDNFFFKIMLDFKSPWLFFYLFCLFPKCISSTVVLPWTYLCAPVSVVDARPRFPEVPPSSFSSESLTAPGTTLATPAAALVGTCQKRLPHRLLRQPLRYP